MNNAFFNAGKYIMINILNKTLELYQGSQLVKTYRIAVGKLATPTLIGQYKIVTKIINPGGSLGTRWLGLSVSNDTYGIHGTNIPSSIRKTTSSGCIRMCNGDIEQLFSLVNINTPVLIVAESEKTKSTDNQDNTKADYSKESASNGYSEDLTEQPINNVSETPLKPLEQSTDPEPNQWGFYYKAIPGDTLWTIARRFGIPVQLLLNNNPLENPNRIYPGQKIFIPKGRIGF